MSASRPSATNTSHSRAESVRSTILVIPPPAPGAGCDVRTPGVSFQAVFLQAAIHRAAAESQRLGCLADVSVVAGECALGEGAVHFIEGHFFESNGASGRASAQAEIGGAHQLSLRQQDSTLDRVIELAHISRPGMVEQKLRRARVEARNAFAIALCITTQEGMRQKCNALAAS